MIFKHAALATSMALIFLASPANATRGGHHHGGSSGGSSGGTSVPEPADFALFAAGVVGLMIGRRSSRKRAGRKAEK
jgi:hypothetical protein